MSNFKDWLYWETLKIAELRKVYYDLHEAVNRIDQLGYGNSMKNIYMHLYRANCALAQRMITLEEDLKDACMKHLRRNKRRNETNENK